MAALSRKGQDFTGSKLGNTAELRTQIRSPLDTVLVILCATAPRIILTVFGIPTT